MASDKWERTLLLATSRKSELDWHCPEALTAHRKSKAAPRSASLLPSCNFGAAGRASLPAATENRMGIFVTAGREIQETSAVKEFGYYGIAGAPADRQTNC